MKTAIETKNLTVVYRGKWGIQKQAVSDLSIKVSEGAIFGFIGHNGAGKTTTIKILTGLCRATSGDAEIMGTSVKNVIARNKIGFLPENPYFYEYLTAEESLTFYARLHGIERKEIAKRVDKLLDGVGLAKAKKTAVRGFSKGMKQRLGLAQAMVHNPDVYILDEPLSGLDPVGRREVREKIIELKKNGSTIFFTSHVLADVEMLCDEVALVSQGKLVSFGKIDDLINREVISIDIHGEGFDKNSLEKLQKISTHLVHKDNITFVTVNNEKKAQEVKDILEKCGGTLRAMIPHRENLEDFYIRNSRGV
ncbi:ABC transporter ATP-binding protein [Candidatus Uabimicrobium sp. HlEnr_7]|uniref:ABC transporter ATP-binding protein n=1 Tax=Candidatus Uabimicrobium helgolandensis TaxID=3095367 RepID=UPI003556F06F